jgi:hypothetical protein
VLSLAVTMILAAPISTQSTASPPGVSFALCVLRHIFGDSLHSASSGDASDRLARKAKPSGNRALDGRLPEWS